MSPQPIHAESRELLARLSSLLIDQHKLLLDRERGEYEKTHEPVSGPGPFSRAGLWETRTSPG